MMSFGALLLLVVIVPIKYALKVRLGIPLTVPSANHHKKMSNPTILSPVVHRTLKLPVWPIWNGVFAQVADWVRLPSVANALVNAVGGRVIPMQLVDFDTSPFLMLVHHSHSFSPFDPFRYLTRLLLPEGFPAHPHAGFDTVTYCLEGGLRHRDSEGTQMKYGDGEVQWMRAGRGVMHEEMWDTDFKNNKNINFNKINNFNNDVISNKKSNNFNGFNLNSLFRNKRIEIYQLWVNLPKHDKNVFPKVTHLKIADLPVLYGKCEVFTGEDRVASSMTQHQQSQRDQEKQQEQQQVLHDYKVKVICGDVTVATTKEKEGKTDRITNTDNHSSRLKAESEVEGTGEMNETITVVTDVGLQANMDIPASPVTIMHVIMDPHSTVNVEIFNNKPIPVGVNSHGGVTESTENSVVAYVRRGSYSAHISSEDTQQVVKQGGLIVFKHLDSAINKESKSDGIGIESATSGAIPNSDIFTLNSGAEGLDCLVLIGQKLNEPVLWHGPIVQADQDGVRNSATIFNSLPVNSYWDHKITDMQWKEHIKTVNLQGVISKVLRLGKETKSTSNSM